MLGREGFAAGHTHWTNRVGKRGNFLSWYGGVEGMLPPVTYTEVCWQSFAEMK
jgi:hypothetical protein